MVKAIDGLNMTLGIQFKPSMYAERTVLRSLKPGAIVGDAVVVEISGDDPATFTVTAVHDGIPTCPDNQAERVANGEFWPAAIPPSFY